MLSSSGADLDFISLWNYDTGSVINIPSWQEIAIASAPRSLLIADFYEPQVLQLGSFRNNVQYAADVWYFSGVTNPGINVPWAYLLDFDSGKQSPIYAS